MKNVLMLFTVVVVLSLAVLGCNWSFGDSKSSETNTAKSANSNKTLTDKGVDAVVGEGKIGVPECDEVIDMLTAEGNNPDDDFMTKAAKQFFYNKIKEAIKKNVEENKTDKVEMAKNCKEFKTQLDNFKSKQESGK
ncbi:MAG TPA: hypothetical protein PKA82_09435 [Pyrinomonadaceae bacterium]|nr:hypothetical protein [Pyrinomonadaceae bacterium]